MSSGLYIHLSLVHSYIKITFSDTTMEQKRTLFFTYKQASTEESSHQPDLKRDLIIFQNIAIGEEQQQVGYHTQKCRGQQH